MRTQIVVIVACLFAAFSQKIAAEPFDLVIRGGRVVDGTGAPWYAADIGIREGRIAAIGRLEGAEAKQTIDAAGLIVAPGFIDMMGQTASPCLENPAAALNLLTQGITTINAGEGASAAPLSAEESRSAGWSTMAEYFAVVDKAGMPLNCVQTVGHTQVRRVIIGDVDRRPSPEEMERMKGLVREGMQAGAIGLSTALIYPPAVYATTEEITELAKVAGQHGGGYYTHMRNEGDRLLEAIDEALTIGRAAGTRVHIFHLKAAGQQNWGKMPLAIARIQAARAEGQQVAADVYPYINNGLGLAAFIPPRHSARGQAALIKSLDDKSVRAQIRREMETDFSYENWYRHIGFDWNRVVLGGFHDGPYAAHNGKSLAQIAKALGKDPWDVFFDAVRLGCFAMPQSMSEANLIRAMRQEFISFCTDVGPAGNSRIAAHPRAYGAFPRILSRYVQEQGVLSLEQAVSQMSALAANEVLLYDRGRLAPGLAADLVIFDPQKIVDRATLAQPTLASEGMRHVIVAGSLVLQDGKYTGARPGRVLRGPGCSAASQHRFVIQGENRLAIVAADGSLEWEMPWGPIHDVHVLPNGNITVQQGSNKVVEIDRTTRKVVWSYDSATSNGNQGKKVEVHSFQPLPDGGVMIAESGPARIIEVDRQGKLLQEVRLKVEHPNPHTDTRLVRKLSDGHYLVCHEGDGTVREYDSASKVVWEYEVPMFGQEPKGGHGPEAFGNKAFSAVRLANGNTLIGGGNGHCVLEVTREGKIVWEIHQRDLPGIVLAWVTTLEVLPSGNYMIGNCHAGAGNPLLIELNPKTKQVVWQYDGFDKFGNSVSNSQLLDVAGKSLR